MAHKRQFVAATAVMLLVVGFAVQGQSKGHELLIRGIDAFGSAQYAQALRTFREIILDSSLIEFHDEAYFWTAKSYMALGQHEDAEKHLEFFIEQFKDSPNYSESLYQRGRLLYLQEQYEAAVHALGDFIAEYPQSPFVANAYFWVGDSLYALGQFDSAEELFSIVVEEYPASFKVEAARYRIALIELKDREQELLKLLKWSHEEYLKALETFQRREKSYEQALASYQRRIAELTSRSKDEQIRTLSQQGERLQEEIQSHKQQITALNAQLEQYRTGVVTSSQVSDERRTLLDMKAELLELKSYYLNQLR